jgi:hypothetical protein
LKLPIYLFVIITLASPVVLFSQEPAPVDSSILSPGKEKKDTLSTDSLKTITKKKKKSEFNSKLIYSAKDSMTYSAVQKKAYLYGDAKVEYQDIVLTAAYIEYDFGNSIVFAKGVPGDSISKKLTGIPDFKQTDNQFTADSMLYNFKTQKGKTFQTNTKEGEGFLLANITKKQADGSFHIKGGHYTTCDDPHPHFYLNLSKAVVIPNNKIVSGPVNFVLEDVPLPLFIPFGFFPNKRKGASGVRIPQYGENSTKGFYLTDGGYYFILNDYMDLLLTGDIYSKGTWGISGRTTYARRYKYSGSFSGRFYENHYGDKGLDLTKERDFSITWDHRQDPKANPTRSFSASVSYSSTSFDKNHNYLNRQDLTQNSKSSSISYNKSWKNMNLSANLRHSQSSSTKDVSLTIPSVTFNVNRFYPFRKSTSSGEYKWYENIQLSYSSQLENSINAKEDDLFTKKTLNNAKNGYKHTVPLSVNFKFLKYFNFTPSMTYTGMFNTTQIKKSWVNNAEKVDTLHKFTYAHGYNPTMSLSFNPTLYGMATFKKEAKIQQIRHVMTPTIGFSFVPDMKNLVPNYYKSYTKYAATDSAADVNYLIYERSLFQPPNVQGRSGSINFSLGNSLEMKIKSDKDTVTGVKKVKIIETLNVSTNYNIYAKEFNLSPFNITGSTKLFKEFGITFNGTVDPYDTDAEGRKINRYYWKKHKGIGRLTNAGLSFGYTFKSSEGTKKEGEQKTGATGAAVNDDIDTPPAPAEEYSYFSIPWSFRFSYSLNYNKVLKTSNVVQSLSFGGSISLTKKWSVGFESGYDFEAKNFSYTTFNISRNLHCWVMTFDCAPFGQYRFYNFRITALSTLLNDLKYETRKDYYDYNYLR